MSCVNPNRQCPVGMAAWRTSSELFWTSNFRQFYLDKVVYPGFPFFEETFKADCSGLYIDSRREAVRICMLRRVDISFRRCRTSQELYDPELW